MSRLPSLCRQQIVVMCLETMVDIRKNQCKNNLLDPRLLKWDVQRRPVLLPGMLVCTFLHNWKPWSPWSVTVLLFYIQSKVEKFGTLRRPNFLQCIQKLLL